MAASRPRYLTEDELRFVRLSWGHMTQAKMAAKLGCSKQAISSVGRKLGLLPSRTGPHISAPPPKRPPPVLPVVTNGFIQPPSRAQLMAGR